MEHQHLIPGCFHHFARVVDTLGGVAKHRSRHQRAGILGNMLFGKRELLKGRTQYLESSITKIGKLIEEQVPEVLGLP